jgi:hypothetical protein
MSTAAPPVRWWVAPPGSDESLGSVVARAAAFFECEPKWLWANLLGGRADIDMDDPPAGVLVRLAGAIGIAARNLQGHRLADAPWLLARDARTAYCPLCWAEQGGEAPAMRRAWHGCLQTICSLHGAPLMAWRTRKRPPEWNPDALNQTDRDILELIDHFSTRLEACLFRGEPWPSDWKGNALAARTMLLRVSFNYEAHPQHPPASDVVATTALRPFIHGPIHALKSKKRLRWEDFREIADPSVRRAALWLVAWRTIPDLDERFRPGWFT